MAEPQATPVKQTMVSPALSFAGVVRSFTPALRELLVSDILIRFCERIPYVWIIVWAMNHGGLDAARFSYLYSSCFCPLPLQPPQLPNHHHLARPADRPSRTVNKRTVCRRGSDACLPAGRPDYENVLTH